MVGYSEMKEVLLWAQTNAPAHVQFQYWDLASPDVQHYTKSKITDEAEAFTVKLIADQVEPGRRYGYNLLINSHAAKFDYPTEFQTQTLWQWRTDAPDFTIAVGSCAYVNEEQYDRPGKPYGGEYEIFTSIHKKRPDAMLWLGDNIYLREADWNTRTGILHRYTHQRSLPELQPLLASAHNYAIWDDHDFGPNNSDRSFIHKDKTLEAFQLFWGNPTYGIDGRPGATSFFQFSDIDFFLMDDRYYRSANNRKTGERSILGKEQLEWLIDALAFSQAPFKMVAIGGQVLNTAEMHENYINNHASERAHLLKRIEEENIKGVIFLTGDRHHTELSRMINDKGNVVYDLTVSPLTSGFSTQVTEENKLRVENTMVNQRNFGLLEFTGPKKERKLTVRILDVNGKELWTYIIEEGK